jgi:predicted transposase/invertase (TIGR01784 family)
MVFKTIMFKHPKVFKEILELSLNRKIEKIKYLNSELPINYFTDKARRLDVYLETTDSYVDVEVNKYYKEYIKNKNLGYGFLMYCQTVEKGDTYDLYKKIEMVNFIFNKKNKEAIVNSYLKDQFGNITSNMLLYSEIYIENFKQMYYNKEVENIKKYKYYIMLSLTVKKLDKFNKEYGDEIVKEYYEELKKLNMVDEFKPWFSKEEDERRIRNSEKALGRKEGIKEGIKEGEKSKQLEIAKNMIKKNIDIQDIIEITGLSKEAIEKLK